MTKKEIVHLKGGKITPLVNKKKEPTPKGVMRYASKILNKLAPQWTARQDLQKLTTEVSQVCELEDKRGFPAHTKTFVSHVK